MDGLLIRRSIFGLDRMDGAHGPLIEYHWLCSDSGGSLDTVAGERRERIRALRNSCRPSLPPTVPPRIGGSTSSTNSGSDGACCSGRPPTPPLHRFPSWESRIYQVAADGLQVAGPQQQADSANNNGRSAGAHGHSSAGYCDISVPVYATVKGVSFNYVSS
uniref:Uncharacterized protein n=1 Tax=Timema shepardi TaxID=629360 RepID=A0A7R9B0M8_TIMSH|nr:unnamed protein product [Timema shepardi]